VAVNDADWESVAVLVAEAEAEEDSLAVPV
jgi:hypothetical protein